jgi:DNA polymerase
MSFKKLIKYLSEVYGEREVFIEGIIPKERILAEIENECRNCKKCILSKTRKNITFGNGNPYSEIMVIGEAPGEEEEKLSIPFVGKAGRKLTEILIKYGIEREKIYITNTIKCRPPQNREPRPEELKECFYYLKKEIEIISPKIILCLGRYAAITILGEDKKISDLRTNEYERFGAKVFVTYHPSAILRKPELTPLLEEDIERISKYISK